MKAHNKSLTELEPGDFLSSGDYEILKGIIASQNVLDLQYISFVLQKDLRYLSEILRKLKLTSFNIKKQVPKRNLKDFYPTLWPILSIISIILGAGLYFLGFMFVLGGVPVGGYLLLFTSLGLIFAPYFLYYRRRSRGIIWQKRVAQYVTAFKSRQEIDAFIAKIQELERTKRSQIEQQRPVLKRYYLSFQIAALLGLVEGIIFIAFGIWFGYNQIIQFLPPTAFGLWVPGVGFVLIPCFYYSNFRGDSLIRSMYELEKHFQESLPVYNALLNILSSEGNAITVNNLEARNIKGNIKESIATFSSEGRRKLQWWRQRPVMNGLIGVYAPQFPLEIIHYIPSLGLLIRPIKGDVPAQLEDWQMDLLRGIVTLERRVEISQYLRLAQIPRRNFMGALYRIIASGTIDLDLKGDIIELRDEKQLNQMISQLQLAFQGWTG